MKKIPGKLADYLLKDDPKLIKEKINAAMNSEYEKFISVKNPVPVFIT